MDFCLDLPSCQEAGLKKISKINFTFFFCVFPKPASSRFQLVRVETKARVLSVPLAWDVASIPRDKTGLVWGSACMSSEGLCSLFPKCKSIAACF